MDFNQTNEKDDDDWDFLSLAQKDIETRTKSMIFESKGNSSKNNNDDEEYQTTIVDSSTNNSKSQLKDGCALRKVARKEEFVDFIEKECEEATIIEKKCMPDKQDTRKNLSWEYILQSKDGKMESRSVTIDSVTKKQSYRYKKDLNDDQSVLTETSWEKISDIPDLHQSKQDNEKNKSARLDTNSYKNGSNNNLARKGGILKQEESNLKIGASKSIGLKEGDVQTIGSRVSLDAKDVEKEMVLQQGSLYLESMIKYVSVYPNDCNWSEAGMNKKKEEEEIQKAIIASYNTATISQNSNQQVVTNKNGTSETDDGDNHRNYPNSTNTNSWRNGDEEMTYHVTNQVIVDPYGERGTYRGSLSERTGMPHGRGRMEYTVERWYDGDWKNGRWSGQGTLSNGNGDLYKGELMDDHKHGKGIYEFADGRIFNGEYNRGEMVVGKMKYVDGSTYEGMWEDGMRHGKGKCVFADASVYEGEFIEGEFHGQGKMTWTDGGWYDGEWWKGDMQGQGKEVRADGSIRHDGWWSNGQPLRS